MKGMQWIDSNNHYYENPHFTSSENTGIAQHHVYRNTNRLQLNSSKNKLHRPMNCREYHPLHSHPGHIKEP